MINIILVCIWIMVFDHSQNKIYCISKYIFERIIILKQFSRFINYRNTIYIYIFIYSTIFINVIFDISNTLSY